MSWTVEPDGQGGSTVTHSGGRAINHVGITAGEVDELTGEYKSGWNETQMYNQFVGDDDDVLSPEDRIRARLDVPFEDIDEEAVQRNQDYLDALASINPGIHQAVQWASRNLPAEFVEQYNTHLDNEMWEELNADVEQLMNLWREAGFENYNNESDESSNDGDDLDALASELGLEEQLEKVNEESRGDLQGLAQDLLSGEPDYSLATGQMEQAESLYASGDYNGAMVTSLSAAFHSGQMSAKEAVAQAVRKIGIKGAIDAYTRIAYGYSATGNETVYGRN